MKMETLPCVDYDSSSSGESLFALWERGEDSQMPAPLSVRRRRYRQLIAKLIKRHQPKNCARVLSVGAGNGFTEADLKGEGFRVLATDRSEVALEYCRLKGLKTLNYEFPTQSLPTPEKFDVIYCDGLLGHLWQSDGYARCWTRFAEFARVGALLILSNDLADTDDMPNLSVKGAPEAGFFRPPAGWFAQDAEASQLWTALEVRLLLYFRRGQPRRREIVSLRCLLVDERKEANGTSNIERRDFGLVE